MSQRRYLQAGGHLSDLLKPLSGPVGGRPMPAPLSADTRLFDDRLGGGLPPWVPPGSTPTNGGINPRVRAWITPDGRYITGYVDDNGQIVQGGMGGPVSTHMPLGSLGSLIV